MRYSQAFIPTLKEAPKDATMPSHVLLLRAGYARPVGAGLYELLPLGLRVIRNVSAIVRDEMDAAGAQELLMPALLPSEYFKESGRWETFGDTLLRLRDRKQGEYHLGPTHEEIITDLVRRDIHSYRQLPVTLYQIQTKFRDEPRPRAGLLRCREFIMKDAYSFDTSAENARTSYERMREVYRRIFTRMGLEFRLVAAHSGAMGGSTSAEFQVLASTGEDAIVACTSCDYAANVEVAEARPAQPAQPEASRMKPVEKVSTPDTQTIAQLVEFLANGLTPAQTLKSLLYVAGDRVVLAVVRGDHEVNEIKLAQALGVNEVFLASEAEVHRLTGAHIGYAGPVGYDGEIVADHAVAGVLDAVAGANETGVHLRNVNYGRDFQATLADIRSVGEGDNCVRCGQPLKAYRGIEAGHIFILGTHYSEKMGANFLDESGKEAPVVMGCYGIGVSRLVAAIIEQNHDDAGIRWPLPVAPYQVLVTPVGKDDALYDAGERLYAQLQEAGFEVLLDDRRERPGVKFKDADLLGIPLRVTVGAKAFGDGEVELKRRDESEARRVPFEGCVDEIRRIVDEATARACR